MYQRNLFLIQIEHANKLAQSSWPQERRIALILLENLFEISIKRKVEQIFHLERSGWDEKREISSKKKSRILRYYPDMLTFAVQKKIISAEENKKQTLKQRKINLTFGYGMLLFCAFILFFEKDEYTQKLAFMSIIGCFIMVYQTYKFILLKKVILRS